MTSHEALHDLFKLFSSTFDSEETLQAEYARLFGNLSIKKRLEVKESLLDKILSLAFLLQSSF